MGSLTPSDMLAPVSADEFFAEHAFKRPLLVRGDAGKFENLFTWQSLNRILSYSRHDALRVHLDQVGVSPDQLTFTHEAVNVRGERIPRIDAGLLYERLRGGATLVVDAVNDVDPQVARLSEELAAKLSARRATTVLFASFGHTPGFAIHWDNRDVYALQVEGRKRWSVFEPSVVAPLDRGDQHTPGGGEPGALFWEGTLERGDMLYVPRGWWHEVTSEDTPSLHLILGFGPVTALDYLSWATDHLEGMDLMRLDMPLFASPRDLDEYERTVKREIAAQLERLSIADFLAYNGAAARAQTHVSLPYGIDDDAELHTDQTVRVSDRLSTVDVSNGRALFISDGRQVMITRAAADIARRLLAEESATIAQLADELPHLELDAVRGGVASLIAAGLAHTV